MEYRYKEIQKALENELGPPYNRLRSIMNLLDPDNRLSYWQKDGIKIEHYLLKDDATGLVLLMISCLAH